MSALSRKELFEQWAERCFGVKEYLTSPFSYEPQAAHSCPDCGLVFVGTSAGDVFVVDGTSSVGPSPAGCHLKPIDEPFKEGVSAIEGCWHCTDGLLVASGRECLVVGPNASTKRPLVKMASRITSLRTFRLGRGERILFVVDERRAARVYLLSGEEERALAQRRLDWAPRWVDAEATVSHTRGGTLVRWLVVSADGRMTRMCLDVERGSLDTDELPPLAQIPRCVGFAEGRAGERVVLAADKDALYEVAPGMAHLGQYATLVEQPRIQFIGLRYLFGVPMLTVCAAQGWAGACQWPTARGTHRPTWFLGPALDAGTIGVWVSPHARDASGAIWTALLSDNRVLRIALRNPFKVREALRGMADWESESGAERYAQFTVAQRTLDGAKAARYVRKDGDARCLEGALIWLEEAPTDRLDAEGYIRLSAEILIAASRLGREAVLTHARKLQTILVHQLRGSRADQIDTLQPWLNFLDRYFVNAPFLLERKLRLESFVDREPPKSLDALLHAARLRHQGFDLLQETPQVGVWALATARDNAGRRWLAAAGWDGSIWKARVSTSGELENRALVLPPSTPGELGYFGAYSRVLAFAPCAVAGDELLAAPRRQVGAKVDGLKMPPWPEKGSNGGHGDDDKTQIYSLLAVDGGFLVGTRSPARPLAFWTPFSADGGLKYIDSPFGPRRRERGPAVSGGCRVWALAKLWPDWLAAGTQDGHLHMFRWSVDKPSIDPAQTRSFFLGSSVRVLLRFKVGQRAFLAAGTEGGLLFVLELDRDRPTEFTIKFRETFRSSVVSIFTNAEGSDATRLFVLDHRGGLSTFDLTPGSFLGQRNRRYDVWHAASAAAWLGRDESGRELIAVGGWDGKAGRGLLKLVRVLDYDRTFLRASKRKNEVKEEIREALRLDPERAEALLASIPVGNASLRAALAPYAAHECVSGVLRRISDALQANPDDVEELKTLLDAERNELGSYSPAEASERLHDFIKGLISDAGKLKPNLATSPRLRAATLRRIVNANTLRFWRRAKLDPNLLQRFVHGYLQDPEPYIRQELMRSLAEALYGLVRMAKAHPAANLPQEAFPGERGWAWVVEVMALHLHAHQAYGSAYDCEIDPLGWGATSVLVSLIRLFPNATLAILSDLSRHRVPGPVIPLIRRRLRSGRDKDSGIVAKIKYYLPWEVAAPPRGDLLARSRDGARELPRVEGSPDDVYLSESALPYQILADLLQVNGEDEMAKLRDTMAEQVNAFLGQEAKDEAGAWLESAISELILSADGARRKQIVGSQEDKLWLSAARLPSPEREMALGTLKHWRRILVPDLPRQGMQIGNYKLGPAVQKSPTVFEVEGRDDYLIAIFIHKSRRNVQRMANAWRKIRDLSADRHTKLVHIIDVVDDPPFPTIVMERLDGQDLAREWNELLSQPAESRFALALQLYDDVTVQLDALHRARLCHGDVKPRNIVAVKAGGGHRFYLIDFDSVCSDEPEPAPVAPLSEADSEFGPGNLHGEALPALQRKDSEHLLDIAVHLLAKQNHVRSLDPAQEPPIDPVDDEGLGARAQALVKKWRRHRRAFRIAFVCAPSDEVHLEKLYRHLKPYADAKGLDMWRQSDLLPGSAWEQETHQRLRESQFVVLMVTADLLAYRAEQLQILEQVYKSEDKPPCVIPVMVKPYDVDEQWFGHVKRLPENGDGRKTVQKFGEEEDEAWDNVARGIKNAIAAKLNDDPAESARRRAASSRPPTAPEANLRPSHPPPTAQVSPSLGHATVVTSGE